jgi:TonB family protein
MRDICRIGSSPHLLAKHKVDDMKLLTMGTLAAFSFCLFCTSVPVSATSPNDSSQNERDTTVLLVTIDDKGVIQNVVVEHSSGSAQLDKHAVEYIKNQHFNPGMKDGKPVGGVARVPVHFE